MNGYGFWSFAKNIAKNLYGKYSQKILDQATKFATEEIKAISKRAIRKTAEATGDLIGNKIANIITKNPPLDPIKKHQGNKLCLNEMCAL